MCGAGGHTSGRYNAPGWPAATLLGARFVAAHESGKSYQKGHTHTHTHTWAPQSIVFSVWSSVFSLRPRDCLACSLQCRLCAVYVRGAVCVVQHALRTAHSLQCRVRAAHSLQCTPGSAHCTRLDAPHNGRSPDFRRPTHLDECCPSWPLFAFGKCLTSRRPSAAHCAAETQSAYKVQPRWPGRRSDRSPTGRPQVALWSPAGWSVTRLSREAALWPACRSIDFRPLEWAPVGGP